MIKLKGLLNLYRVTYSFGRTGIAIWVTGHLQLEIYNFLKKNKVNIMNKNLKYLEVSEIDVALFALKNIQKLMR